MVSTAQLSSCPAPYLPPVQLQRLYTLDPQLHLLHHSHVRCDHPLVSKHLGPGQRMHWRGTGVCVAGSEASVEDCREGDPVIPIPLLETSGYEGDPGRPCSRLCGLRCPTPPPGCFTWPFRPRAEVRMHRVGLLYHMVAACLLSCLFNPLIDPLSSLCPAPLRSLGHSAAGLGFSPSGKMSPADTVVGYMSGSTPAVSVNHGVVR